MNPITSRIASLTATIDELVARLRLAYRPLPEVTVEHTSSIPGWILRLTFSAAVPAFVYAVAAQTPVTPGLVITVAAALTIWSLIRPGPGISHTTVLLAALAMLTTPDPFHTAALWLAPLAYALTRLGWWAAHVGLRTRIELTALRRTATRDGVVILVTAALGAVAASVAGQPLVPVVALGSAALAALAWLVLRRHDEVEHAQN